MIEERSCIVVKCDDCGRAYSGYEEEFTCHFDSLDEFIKQQEEDEESGRWQVRGTEHLCPECACGRDGHPVGDDNHVYRLAGREPFMYCRCGTVWVERPEGRGLEPA